MEGEAFSILYFDILIDVSREEQIIVMRKQGRRVRSGWQLHSVAA
jgi:hypothetical protein